MASKRKPRCAEPRAPWAKCENCGVKVKTCERKTARRGVDYRCPVHPDGYERGAGWVCSDQCGDAMEAKENA